MAKETYGAALSEGRELTAKAEKDLALFREPELAALAAAINARRSVLLVGPAGVGKTSIVRAFAQRLRQNGPRKLYEFAAMQMLTGTTYLGQWQTKTAELFDAATKISAVLYFSDIWNLAVVGKSSTRTDTVWDALRPRLLNGDLQVIGEVTAELALELKSIDGFLAPFELIEVAPLTTGQVENLIAVEAQRLSLPLDPAGGSRLVNLCSQFLPAAAGPGPALRLVEQIRHYWDEKCAIGEKEPVSVAFVDKVFAIYTGLPRFVVSREEVRPVAEIRDWFRARIIGQRDAIEAVVQMITLFKAGLQDTNRPIGSFLFVGPTGVGKTELARTLAMYLFGSEKRLLRFDMSEYKDYHSFEMLIGDPKKPERPARLVDPVRAQPFQVVLFDEIEKGHANVWDLLLQVLDDGRLTPGIGAAVNFRSTIVIATTNVGAQASTKRSMGFTGAAAGADAERLQAELEATFRPELLNRFQHIVRFSPLTKGEVKDIARTELRRALDRDGIVGRRLVVDVDEAALDLVVARGYDEKYGARSLKRQLQHLIIMPIATLLVERQVADASIIRVSARQGEIRVVVVESAESRSQRRESAPLRMMDGRKVGREHLATLAQDAQTRLLAITQAMDLADLQRQRDQLEQARRGADLWKDPKAAAQLLQTYDELDQTIARVQRLQKDGEEIQALLQKDADRDEWTRRAEQLQRHASYVVQAQRELVTIGAAGLPGALIEVSPVGRARPARDLLYETYCRWAEHRKYRITIVREPMTDEEPVMVAIHGAYAYGYLRAESGHHRLRAERDTFVARVSVASLLDESGTAILGVQKALKQVGQFGGKVRSRVETLAGTLVVQNAGSLAESRELAQQLAPSWQRVQATPETVVRRYDREPFLVRDFLTALTTGRPDSLQGEAFHELLCNRIDAGASATGAGE